MIADGIISGVQIKLNNPIDRLLRKYYMMQINADIHMSYVGILPVSADLVTFTEDALMQKYPFYKNSEQHKIDMVQKYNRSLQMAEILMKKEEAKKAAGKDNVQ